MKKRIGSICVLAVLVIAALAGGIVAQAGTFEEEADTVFRQALDEIIVQEDVTAETIAVTKEPLYDLSLERLGYVYIMHYDGKEGFAIVINTRGTFDLVEMYFDAADPYGNLEGLRIYVNFMTYWVYNGENYVDAETGNVIDDQIVATWRTASYCGAGVFTTGTETIYYTNKSVNKHEIVKKHPQYYNTSDLGNTCTPVAGANLVGFWTRYYPELIPGFTPGALRLGQYRYNDMTDDIGTLIENLYYAMGTNTIGDGTTIDQFKTGMNSYVSGKGRNISYASCMSGSSFNYSLAKQKLESGTPIVLFVYCFRIDTMADGTNQTIIDYLRSDTTHTMAGFGYNETTYTLSNGTTRTDRYVQVATGLSNKSTGYYNIDYNTTIDDCYAVTIY